MEINKELDKLLKQVEKPARYIGGEIHSAVKNPDQVSEVSKEPPALPTQE